MFHFLRKPWLSPIGTAGARRASRSLLSLPPHRRRLRIELLEDRRLLATVIVSNNLDLINGNTSSIANLIANNGGDGISLREAITAANNTANVGGADQIHFAILGAGPHTISPTSALPTITGAVVIDGYTQAGAAANTNSPNQALNTALKIELAGNLASSNPGLRLAVGSSGSVIRGLAVNRFDNNLWIDSGGNTIAGNFIGTNIAGTAALPGGSNGVLIISAASNTIGGTSPSDSNLISGNTTNGITIVETGASNTIIRGNRIGTDITGTVDLGNTIFGVYLYRAPNTVIGGSAPGASNLISGNNNSGIWMDENSHDTIIQGNKIGTNLAGTQKLANVNHGIYMNFNSRVVVGGLAASEGNTIAGSGNAAISIQNGAGPVIRGNWIGTDATGTINLGNFAGVFLVSVKDSIIERNTIAFNGTGIQINGNTFGDPETGNLISRNSIHSLTSAVAIDLYSSFETIGPNFPQDATDSDTGANNHQNFPIITSVTNVGGLTRVQGTLTSQLNSNYRLEFFASASPTTSGFGPGQTFLDDLDLAIGGASNTVGFTIDLPALPFGQPFVTATATDVTIQGVGPRNNTSEFSPAVPIDTVFIVTSTADQGGGTLREALAAANFVAGPNTILFNIPANDPHHFYYRNDGVAGRVTKANIATTAAANDASIPDIDPDWAHSWYSIELNSKLIITGEAIIDGYTQPGAVANTNPLGQGLNSVLRVEINGANATGIQPLDGLIHVAANNTTLRGVVINRPAGLNTSGVHVLLESGTGSRIEGNYIGTDVSGTYAYPLGFNTFPPVFAGVGVNDNPAAPISGNTIGGPAPAARNLVSGTSAGVAFFDTAPNNAVQGNLIGTDRSGTKAIANRVGVWIESVGITIGGAAVGAGNVISGNETGIQISDFANNSHDNLIQNNWIGTDGTGSGELGNPIGVVVSGDKNEFRGNKIAFNGGAGIRIGSTAIGNLLSQNSIFSNETMGIDLGINGITLNDEPPASNPPDQDTGGNNLQNFPVLSSVLDVGGGTQIQGTLASTPNSTFRIEFFANRERDQGIFDFFNPDIKRGTFAEGQTYVGSVNVTTNPSGNGSFTANLPALPADQDFVTATATDITDTGSGPRNHTSEFSPVAARGGPSTVVTKTGDVGVGTLREAIFTVNIEQGYDTITFNIPANDSRHFYYQDDGIAGHVTPANITATTQTNDANIVGIDPDWAHSWYSVLPMSELPEIERQVHINGYSQSGSSRNTLAAPGPLNTVLKVAIDGLEVAGDGLRFRGGAEFSFVEGLAIHRFAAHGLHLQTLGGNRVYGNFIGTDVSGTIGMGNGADGVFLQGDSITRVGGSAPAMRNIVSANAGNGVTQRAWGGSLIQGNLIGVDRGATELITNGVAGVFLQGAFDTLGGTGPGTSNLIATDGATAVMIFDDSYPALDLPETTLLDVEPYRDALQDLYESRELFFTTNDPQDAAAVILAAIDLFEAVQNQGIEDLYVQANAVLGNRIIVRENAGPAFGIDLAGDGVTPNDLQDADGGPNNLRNFPVLNSAATNGGMTSVSGILHSVPNVTFRIEFFASSQWILPGHGPGEEFLGAVEATTGASGNASFSFNSPAAIAGGRYVTATATYLLDLDENPSTPLLPLETSEFSAAIPVVQDGRLVGDYNANLMVDAADYALWRRTLGTTGVPAFSGADGDGDGTIDQGDYNLWRAHFGEQATAAGAAAGTQAAIAVLVGSGAMGAGGASVDGGATGEIAIASSPVAEKHSSLSPAVPRGATQAAVPGLIDSRDGLQSRAGASTGRMRANRPRPELVPAARTEDAFLAWLSTRNDEHVDSELVEHNCLDEQDDLSYRAAIDEAVGATDQDAWKHVRVKMM